MSALKPIVTSLILILYCLPASAQNWDFTINETDTGTSYTLVSLAYKSHDITLSYAFIGVSKDGCMMKELSLLVFNRSNTKHLEHGAKVVTSTESIDMYREIVGYDDGVINTQYATTITPGTLDRLGRETPVISGYELTGFTDAVNEYFERTSDLISCRPVDF